MTYQDHLDNLTAEAVTSAKKALDYLDGDQIKWLKVMLNDKNGGIKNWEERGVDPLYTNLTHKIVSRSALSYSTEPTRTLNTDAGVDEAATETYNDILDAGEFGAVMPDADQVARLLKAVIIIAHSVDVVGGEQKIMFTPISRANCDVDYDHVNGRMRSLIYQAVGSSINGNRLYHYWDEEKTQDIEMGDTGVKAWPPIFHGYGMIPVAVLWDKYKPRTGFWHKPAWDELVQLNEGDNLAHTETMFAARFQARPALFTNAELPDGGVIGPDTVVQLRTNPGENVYLEYKAATAVSVSLKVFADCREDLIQSVADNWGVNVDTGGVGSADSGFKLVVREIWNIETRLARLKAAEAFERQMFKVVKAISDQRGYKIPDGLFLEVDFGEPKLAVNAAEAWTIQREKVALGYSPMEEEWRKDNPDITDAQIEERKALLGGGKLPTFGDVDTGGV